MTSAVELHTHLRVLRAERTFASSHGLALNSAYMADLDGDRGDDQRLRRGRRDRDRDLARRAVRAAARLRKWQQWPSSQRPTSASPIFRPS
jgi:hypothetical protein